MAKNKQHRYQSTLSWQPADGETTLDYRKYSRNHSLGFNGKPPLNMSSDPAFLGDKNRHNPEDLMIASLSSCHMLWYLHLAGTHGVEVLDYQDNATAVMEEDVITGGCFTQAILKPEVTISAASSKEVAEQQHEAAHHKCFIANSVNFPVKVEPTIIIAP